MIIDKALYRAGQRSECGDLSEELVALRAGSGPGFIWIGLKDPTDAEFALVDTELGLHPLAVEDAVQGRQRVKIERYDTTVFAALKTLRYVEATSDIETGEVMAFVGDRFVVTVRRGEAAPLTGVRQRLEADPALLLEGGPLAVFHAVLDAIVDTYLDIDEEVQQDLTEIEADVFGGAHDTHSATIYRLKREVLEFKRAAHPLVRPLEWLLEGGGPIEQAELRLRFRDVSDHLLRVVDHVETYDRLLTDVLNAHLAQVSVRQNNDMRKISAWVAMAAVPTMVAGVYGMNFRYMPELGWAWGYPLVLGGMALACGLLYRAFHRSGWL
ncbi:MAG: magnesium/cobalt transporter CorA [Actinomycetota bacterium]|nr:magnesium/cobalt transporter CorA [Actinomycetota bacterium]MDQ3526396.1 magnesium/cobalt transporter CorA [Actinomycetota bacterium]